MTSSTTPAWRDPAFAWPAPAKLNLFLHITGRRADGYHLLQTVFQFIECCDFLHFRVTDDGAIIRDYDIPGVPESSDLVVRAARLLQAQTGCTYGTHIRMEKNLPMGGGLGGGSSDAATVLVALNKLWDLNLDVDVLAELGLRLGADVPVFVRGYAAWAEGVGEQLSPVHPQEPWYLVIIPQAHVNTGEIFSHPELTRDKHALKIRDSFTGVTENVCQPVVEKLYPAVKHAINWLSQYAEARLTGTGACVFAPFQSRDEAARVLDQLPENMGGFVARGANVSPLHKALNKV